MQYAKFGMSASWAIAITLVALMSCGGGSDGGDAPSAAQVKDACIKICQKMSSCVGLTVDCAAQCAENNNGMGQIPPACKTNATLSKVQACLDVACTAVESCFSDATKSCSGSGTGGSGSGTGGSGNSTGGAASGDCSVCTKASACCIPLLTQLGQDTASCASVTAAMCTAAGASQSTLITACQQMLTTGAALNIAACK